MIKNIALKKKIIFLSFIVALVCTGYFISLNYSFKYLFNKQKNTPDVNVASPSGTVTFNLVKLTSDPILPSTKVKYAVRVSSGGAVNVSALGFKLKSTLPISNYVMGTPIVSGIEVKDLSYDSSANTLSFVAATGGWFQIGNGSDLITFDVTAPSSAGTYNSILTNVTSSALPSLIDSNNTEILNSNSLAAVTLVVATPNPAPVGNLEGADCTTISGWACDTSSPSASIQVHFYKDGRTSSDFIGSATANGSRADTASYCGGTSAHGFSFNTPASIMDGTAHSIYAYGIDIPDGNQNPILPNSPKTITCFPAPATAPANFKATCSTDGTQVTLSWSTLNGASKYYLRNDNTSNSWPNGAGDYYDDNVTTISKTVSVTAGAPYHAWVHGVSSTGAVGTQVDLYYTCTSNTGPTIGSLSVKGTTITADDQVAISYNENVTISVSGVTDPDGVKVVSFQRAEDNTTLANLTVGTSGTYSFPLNNIQIGKYTFRVVATDSKNVASTRIFNFFNVKPAVVSISPNGGTFSNMPTVAITNPNGSGSVVNYAFCTTDCATKTLSSVYSAPFLSQAGSRVAAYVTHTASGLSSARTITEVFNQQVIATPTPTPSPTKFPTPTPTPTVVVPTPTPSPTKAPTPTPTATILPTPTPTSGSGVFNLNPVADTYVFGTDTTTNYGTEASLQLKNGSGTTFDRIAFLKFSLNSISGAISSAKLRLYINSAPNGTPTITTAYGLSNDTWTETGLTFNNMPTIGAAISSPLSSNSINTWYEVDITSYIKSEFLGDKNASVVLQADNNLQIGIDSKEGINKPVLVVNTSGNSGSVNTPSFSLTPGAYIYNANNSLENSSVTISTTTAGATIQYCLGAVSSTTCTAYINYTAPLVVNKNFKLYAKAIKSGMVDSSVTTGVYQLVGDLNGDNVYNVSGDVIPLLKAIFETALQNMTLMDLDRNRIVDMRDLILLINLIFA